jgi:hypothetical protein
MEHSAMSLYWPESREEDIINIAVVARIKPVRHNDKSQTARPYPFSLSFYLFLFLPRSIDPKRSILLLYTSPNAFATSFATNFATKSSFSALYHQFTFI